MHSCIYEGWVRHRRFEPVGHAFRYAIQLMLLDLDELSEVFRGRLLWSADRIALARFRREDHLGSPSVPLAETVRDLVAASGRPRPTGAIRLLTQLRQFGYVFNPVSFYFCWSSAGCLEALVAEVNNTPWGERHCYVLDADQFQSGGAPRGLDKEFHVSPFMPMDLQYRWRVSTPGESLAVHLQNWREGRKFFDVTMRLARRPINTANLAWALVRRPLMPFRVVASIYWQALRLWWKGCPFYPHPRHALRDGSGVAPPIVSHRVSPQAPTTSSRTVA